MKGVVLFIQTLCLLLIYTDENARVVALESVPLVVNGEQYSKDLLGIIRRVQDLETSNDVIKSDNRKLQEEVTSLKTYISTLAAENEKTVSDLQSEITDLQAKNLQNEIMIQSLVSIAETESQINTLTPEKQDLLNNTADQIAQPPNGPLHKSQKKDHSSPNDTVQIHERSVGLQRPRIARSENEANIAFYATVGDHHIQHAGVNQNIVFDNVITNLGNAYSKYAGNFRAPVSGTYVFSVTLMAVGTHTTHYSISKNGTLIGRIYLHGKDGSDATSAMTAVLELKQGDDVSIHNVDADESLHGYAYSTFSGFLLQQEYSTSAIVGK